MQETSKNSSPGYLIGLRATLLLSFTGILISYLNRTYHLPSLVLAFWRDCFVALGSGSRVFALFSRGRFRLQRSHWGFFVLYGLTLSLFNSMWTFSVQFNGAAVATVLAYSSPAMTAVLAHYILTEQINGIKVASIVLSMLGIVLVSGAADPAAWKVNAAGIAFGLLTGFFFACYTMLGKTSSNRSIDPWTTMLYGFSSAVFFLFLFNVLMNGISGDKALWLISLARHFAERVDCLVLARRRPNDRRLRSVSREPGIFAGNRGQPDRGTGACLHRDLGLPALPRTIDRDPSARQPAGVCQRDTVALRRGAKGDPRSSMIPLGVAQAGTISTLFRNTTPVHSVVKLDRVHPHGVQSSKLTQ